MDPVKKERVGYLTDFNGIGLTAPLKKDITVYCPYAGASTPAYPALGSLEDGKVTVTAILENVSWLGGVGDPFTFSCYMSSENANLLRTLKQMTLKTTGISAVGWWVANYDPETKVWFEEHYPKAPAKIAAQLNAVGKNDIRLFIADEPVKVAPNIEVNVYNVYFEIVPAANQTAAILAAAGPGKNVVLPWGLRVGAVGGPTG